VVRVLALVLSLLIAAAAAAQTPGATVRPLPGRPGIDGRAWIFVDLYTGSSAVVRPRGADYDLRFSDRKDEGGVARWTVTLVRDGRQTPLTGETKTSFAYVAPGSRYVVVEPLTIIDTTTGQRQALDAGPGMKIIAVAQDGKRLFLERADGEPFELTLP
jgi:hypothetical protein